MTAEVSVMNAKGVALAADSAVTLGASGKVYASADKLFELSRVHPVGVMVYGSADLLGVPWETVIKKYRSELGDKGFRSVRAHADDFIRYLEGNRKFFPDKVRTEFVEDACHRLYAMIRETIRQRLKEELQAKGTLSRAAAEKLTIATVRELLQDIKQTSRFDGCPPGLISSLRSKYSAAVNSAIDVVFAASPLLGKLRRTLRSCAFEFLSRFLPLRSSGVVIAGFGEDQHFPALVQLEIDGMAATQLRYLTRNDFVLSGAEDARVNAFAQGEMVSTFMKGIDPRLQGIVYSSTEKLFSGFKDRLVDRVKKSNARLGARIEKGLTPEIAKLLADLRKEWEDEQQYSYVGPVMGIVASLPKDELGEMAESLVNLTKFKRRVSAEVETVGGPIDVAVITKGDGFVWMRRKHYFRRELNPQYFARQYRGGEL